MSYASEAIEFVKRFDAEFLLALGVAQLLTFFALLILLVQARRLRRRVDSLANSVSKLLSDDATRYAKSLLARAKDSDPR